MNQILRRAALSAIITFFPASLLAQQPTGESSLRRCPPFAFVKRNHFKRPFGLGSIIGWDIYTPGCGIYTYDPAEPEQPPKEIFKREDGTIFDMSLSFDAKKLLFAFRTCPENRGRGKGKEQRAGLLPASADPEEASFHIYEVNVDGTGLRKLTHGRYHDVHPIYLPTGKIAFVSTRVEAHVLCQPGAACALHVMDPDGRDIRRIHFGTLADHSPFLMNDGSILFSRWEYQDKSLTYPQGLWSLNPDGTRLQLFYGNTINEPAVTWQGKEIPGRSEIVCTLAPHHGNPVGGIGIIDRGKGMENPRAITNITPEIPYEPHRDRRGIGDRQYNWSYRDPYPVGKDLFLVAYGGPIKDGPKRYRIYLLHEGGRKELVYEDEVISCFNPLPLTPRPTPHVKPELPPSDSRFGTFAITDIYQGMTGVERGRVKEIRIMRVEPKHCNMRGSRAYDMDPLIGRGTYYVKHCLGTVPVDEKGTAVFRAPAGQEIYFQALDEHGMELQRMGTVTQIMPGETQSCIGCHEEEFSAPPNTEDLKKLLSRTPVDITPPPWGAGPVDFVRHVQPVFDKYCVRCHSGPAPKKGIDLSGDKTRYFNMAYDTLTERKLIHYTWLLGASAKNWKPLSTGSRVSKLIDRMQREPCNVEMDDESKRRIYTWIEANVPYYGTYKHTRPGRPGCRDAFDREPWAQRLNKTWHSKCQACHGSLHEKNRGRNMTWVNLTHPEWSRVLNAPLLKRAGDLERCKPKDGKQPPVFQTRDDPTYQAMLHAIREGKSALEANPRMDMPGAVPRPYPTDFGRLFTGFAGP